MITIYCLVLVGKGNVFRVFLFDFVFFRASKPPCCDANQRSVSLPVETHRIRFGLRRLVLEISVFEVTTPEVFDVSAFRSVILPSTVLHLSKKLKNFRLLYEFTSVVLSQDKVESNGDFNVTRKTVFVELTCNSPSSSSEGVVLNLDMSISLEICARSST